MRGLAIAIVIATSLVLGFACRQSGTQTPAYAKYESDATVPRISAEEAKKEFDAGTAVFVDSRSEVAFAQEHLPGAIVIPFGAGAEDKFGTLPQGKKVIVYCS